ncbi:TIGR04222 domain-containing membrane protein [Streptomyces angustmyceticus]|uniref:Membrane protein n=1 Tax=Streptomyces angustmyceticus TaxID=285578 RepID=A0A5J4LEM5_9ACTN|nr:TIGR04222 domain-containing membrane protein [Streptomyces angustmyceticus]UAL66572.1 TIGR04222 domain-containing membrane protein [Streptomyces angustmyceticus]GES28585.1 membrane protein [Streptomyces angustmyceticus]
MWLFFFLLASGVAALSCALLCRAAVSAARTTRPAPGAAPAPAADGDPAGLTLYEMAYLSGGPHRLADLVLVLMAQQRRLLLTETGWATVVDPVAEDAVERAALTAIGPGGQCRIPRIRESLSGDAAVREVAERLVTDGLALPAAVRPGIATGVRLVRGAALVVVLCAAAALWMAPAGADGGLLLGWFALPLVLTLGTWAVARFELHPYSDWATEAGGRRLPRASGSPAPLPSLTSFALRGPIALTDPTLRAALHSSGA